MFCEYREPPVGFEPTTTRLRIESSTPELRWHQLRIAHFPHASCALRMRTAQPSLMPWSGLEPLCLSAPPPQDGVSTNFTTRATLQLTATSYLLPAF